MTKEEFESRLHALESEYAALQSQLSEKHKEKHAHYREMAQSLCERYKQYDGKRVRVTFEHTERNCLPSRKVCEGFWQGFEFKHNYHTNIYPTLFEIKKDGTPSKVAFSEWDVRPWDEIVSVEEV